MSTSLVGLYNHALQILGATRVVAPDQDTKNARECNACYEILRDRELRNHNWNFAIKRVVLAPLAAAPAFDFSYAFVLPSDFLRALPPNDADLDWAFEIQDGARVLLTNRGSVLNLRYVFAQTDTARFDPLFVDALAAKMAEHMCEAITQSNTKIQNAIERYEKAIAEAKRVNSIENISSEPPEDTWVTCRT